MSTKVTVKVERPNAEGQQLVTVDGAVVGSVRKAGSKSKPKWFYTAQGGTEQAVSGWQSQHYALCLLLKPLNMFWNGSTGVESWMVAK